jgi:predicted lipoprotein with Yx(FWY)xxD motif
MKIGNLLAGTQSVLANTLRTAASLHPMHRGLLITLVLVLATGESVYAGEYPVEVATLEFGHGVRLTDAEGFTLYQYENDLREPGASTCTDECAVRHPPLLVVDASQEIPESWSLVEREAGIQQWAYEGMPLYRYARDSHGHAAYGEGDGWTVAFEPITTPAEMSIASTVLGHVLASSSGRTIYTHAGDEQSESFDCIAECLETWSPLKAPWGAVDYGDFSVRARDDGIHQWAYRDQPLYHYARDSGRGDTSGDGVDGVWEAMILEPAPPVPEWVTVVASDGGALYADPDGITLHMFFDERNAVETAYLNGSHCDEACLDRYWDPVTAPSQLPPIGHWSVVENEDQAWQWAYMGRLVYTSRLEDRPGQLFYTTFRQFQHLKPIMHSLPTLPGVF